MFLYLARNIVCCMFCVCEERYDIVGIVGEIDRHLTFGPAHSDVKTHFMRSWWPSLAATERGAEQRREQAVESVGLSTAYIIPISLDPLGPLGLYYQVRCALKLIQLLRIGEGKPRSTSEVVPPLQQYCSISLQMSVIFAHHSSVGFWLKPGLEKDKALWTLYTNQNFGGGKKNEGQ